MWVCGVGQLPRWTVPLLELSLQVTPLAIPVIQTHLGDVQGDSHESRQDPGLGWVLFAPTVFCFLTVILDWRGSCEAKYVSKKCFVETFFSAI